MPNFENGTYINLPSGVKRLRISAGPQRGKYVHELVMLAKQIGRQEGYIKALQDFTIDDIPPRADEVFPIGETVAHLNNIPLDNWPTNLEYETRSENTAEANRRRRK